MLLAANPDELHEPLQERSPSDDATTLRPASRNAVTYTSGTSGGRLVLDGPDGCTELEVDGDYAGWCRWFAGRRAGVSLRDCLKRAPRLEPSAIRHILGLAVTNGALIAASRSTSRPAPRARR
jgi:hypothetical protein